MATTKGKGAGGRMTRSETVQVRLDPKLKYLAELAARMHRRSLSSFVEWAVQKAVDTQVVGDPRFGPTGENPFEELLGAASEKLWDVDEADRFVKLAQLYPHLLTHDEQMQWKLIQENPYFWNYPKDGHPSLNVRRIRDLWEAIQAAAESPEGREKLDELTEIPF